MQELTEASEGRTSEKRGSLSRASGEEKRDCGEQIRKPESCLAGQRALQKEEKTEQDSVLGNGNKACLDFGTL